MLIAQVLTDRVSDVRQLTLALKVQASRTFGPVDADERRAIFGLGDDDLGQAVTSVAT